MWSFGLTQYGHFYIPQLLLSYKIRKSKHWVKLNYLVFFIILL